MKAVTFQGIKDVKVKQVPDAVLKRLIIFSIVWNMPNV